MNERDEALRDAIAAIEELGPFEGVRAQRVLRSARYAVSRLLDDGKDDLRGHER